MSAKVDNRVSWFQIKGHPSDPTNEVSMHIDNMRQIKLSIGNSYASLTKREFESMQRWFYKHRDKLK